MKVSRNTDHALREALSRLEQRQPAPPEGMTERFMARLAQELADNAAGEETRRRAVPILRCLWLPVAAAAVVILGFILWTDTTNTEDKLPVVVEVQHPTEPTIPSLQPNPIDVPPAVASEASASVPVAVHNPSAKTLIVYTASAPCPASENHKTTSEKSAASSIKITINAYQPIAEVQAPEEDTHIPATPMTNLSPPSVLPEALFTAAEIELDRQAMQAGGRYGYLIAGEAIALARISLRENLSAAFTHIKNHSTKPAKPIAI